MVGWNVAAGAGGWGWRVVTAVARLGCPGNCVHCGVPAGVRAVGAAAAAGYV